MKRLKIILGIFFLILLATSCTATSTIRSASALNQIAVGNSKPDVLSFLGAPTSTSANGSGNECLDYEFVRVGQSQRTVYETAHHVILKQGKVACYGEGACQYRMRNGNKTIINGVRVDEDACS